MNEENNQAEPNRDALAGKIEKLNGTQDRLSKRWGAGEKRTAREQQALVFANRLLACGGTFHFTHAMREFGYSTIWEAMAGELHDQGAKPMKKAENAQEHASLYRTGYYQLNALLLEHWKDVMIFAVPEFVDALRIDCVTVDPDYVVNNSGGTAYVIWEQREVKRAKGQLASTARKLTRVTTPETALIRIAQVASPESLSEMVRQNPGLLELPNPQGDLGV